MKNKILKISIIMVLLLTLVSTNFIYLGASVISYANDNTKTNHPNIEFTVAMKDSSTLSMKVNVKKEGYFNGSITLENEYLKLKETSNNTIQKIEGNTITLNQINAGDKAEIEIKVEPNKQEMIDFGLLKDFSKVSLKGIYKDSTQKDRKIEATREIEIPLANKTTVDDVQNKMDVITNKVVNVNGEEKRVLQLLVNLGVKNDAYPIKEINAKINIPKIDEKMPEVKSMVTLHGTSTYKKQEKDGNIEFLLKNEPVTDNKILWKADKNEEVIVTYIYDKDVTFKGEKITSEEKVSLYDGTIVEKTSEVKLKQEEKNNIIQIKSDNQETSMYKGKLYAGISREYIEKTEVQVNLAKVANEVILAENQTSEVQDIFYAKTVLKQEEFNNILGENGNIDIKNENEKTIASINKNTQVDKNGNFIVDYKDQETKAIKMVMTAPIKEGNLTFGHLKTIKATNTENVKQAKEITTKVAVEYKTNIKNKENDAKKEIENKIELKESTLETNLSIDKESLSTVVKNQVELKATLKANNEKYNLYENPEINIQLPEEVESIKVNNIDLVYENELKVKNYVVEGKTIRVFLEGKQTQYKETAVEGANIIINAEIGINKKSATKQTQIEMTYKNGNEVGKFVKPIKVVAPKDITTIHSVKELGIETIGQEENKKVMLARGKQEKQLETQIEIINNNSETIKNVKVLGLFPTNSKNNNLNIKLLEGITLQEGTQTKIYYTENENATNELQKVQNGWKEELTSLENAKKYLIVIDEVQAQQSIKASYKFEVPANLEYNQSASQMYQVTFENTVTRAIDELVATKIEMQTGIGPKVETKLTAKVGENTLDGQKVVKNGEVIQYLMEVSNVGTEDIENLTLSGKVPEGTTLVEPEANYEYTGSSYYKELNSKTYETTVEKLKVGEVITKQYEVRVNKDVKAGTELKNITQAKYNDVVKQSNENKTVTDIATIRTSVKRVTDRNIDLYTSGTVQYFAIIENMTDKKQDNVKIKTHLSDNLDVKRLAIITGMKSEEVDDDQIHRPNMESDEVSETREITEEDLMKNQSNEEEKTEYIEYAPEVNIGTLEAGETKVVSYDLGINKTENNNKINFGVTTINGKEESNSNNLTDKVEELKINVEMTSDVTEKYIKAGDVINYTILVKNESTSEAKGVVIKDSIPNAFNIQKVMVDGKTVEEIQSNNLELSCDILAKENVEIQIEVVVNYSEGRVEAEPVTNIAYAEIFGEKVASSAEINHIIQANPKEDESGNGDNIEDNEGDNNNKEEGDIAQGTKMITGTAWFDSNSNGKKDAGEQTLSNVKVKLLNAKTNHLVKDKSGKTVETVTNENGVYVLENLVKGKYIAIFEYDNKYTVTKYKAENVSESENSDVMNTEIIIENEKQKVASTDIIEIDSENIADINIGLVELADFDLQLNKYVSKILIQNKAGTTVKEFNDETLAKAEIDAKQINGTTVIIEYKIKVTNVGKVDGYVKKIVDYAPNDLKFNSELNKDWYQADGKLYNASLANDKLVAGESKVVTLTLSKSMTENNTGRINNTAEIAEGYNELGLEDINSTPGNRAAGENDIGAADTILSIRTGGAIYISIIVIALIGLGATALIIIKKNKKQREI